MLNLLVISLWWLAGSFASSPSRTICRWYCRERRKLRRRFGKPNFRFKDLLYIRMMESNWEEIGGNYLIMIGTEVYEALYGWEELGPHESFHSYRIRNVVTRETVFYGHRRYGTYSGDPRAEEICCSIATKRSLDDGELTLLGIPISSQAEIF